MKKIKHARLWLADMWQPFCLACVGLLLVLGLLVFRLGTLTGGMSEHEYKIQQQVVQRTISAETSLTKEPIYLPHKAGLYIFEKLNLHQLILLRGLSVIAGFIAVISMFLILRNWHTSRVALLATAMFATSTWLLHNARFVSPSSLYLLLPALILCALWLHRDAVPRFAAICAIALTVSLLYVPGMIWLIVPGIIWQHKLLWRQLQEREAWVLILVVFLGSACLLPLIIATVQNPNLIKTILGLPQDLPTVKQFALNFARVPWQLIARSPQNPELNLGRLPIIDVFTASVALLGSYAYLYRRQLDRVKLLVGILLFGTILIALGGPVPSLIILPIVYFFVAGGIAMLLQRWFKVFPRNPLARNVGVSLVIVAVVLSCFYNLERYFVAWPNSPVTRATFSRQVN